MLRVPGRAMRRLLRVDRQGNRPHASEHCAYAAGQRCGEPRHARRHQTDSDRRGLVRYRQLEYYRMPYMAFFAMEDASVLTRPDLIRMGIGNEAGASSELPYAESYLGEFERGETTKSGAGHGPLRWVGSPQMGPLRLS